MNRLACRERAIEGAGSPGSCQRVSRPVRTRSLKKGSPVSDPLKMYLLCARRYRLLNREEEVKLARRVRDLNDSEAVNRLITSNLRLVVKIAMDYHRCYGKSLPDLIQEGNLGLLQAARKFDPDRGTKFSYYASFWIKSYIAKFIIDNWRLVKIGTTQEQRKLFYKLAKERDRMIASGVSPDPKLLAGRLDVKEEDVISMTQRLKGEYSINAKREESFREDFEAFLEDPGLGQDEKLSEAQRRKILTKKLMGFRKQLTGIEAEIFDRRIMAERPMVLRRLGEKYNLSRERVRQIQKKVVKDIKAWLKRTIPDFEEEFSDLLT